MAQRSFSLTMPVIVYHSIWVKFLCLFFLFPLNRVVLTILSLLFSRVSPQSLLIYQVRLIRTSSRCYADQQFSACCPVWLSEYCFLGWLTSNALTRSLAHCAGLRDTVRNKLRKPRRCISLVHFEKNLFLNTLWTNIIFTKKITWICSTEMITLSCASL